MERNVFSVFPNENYIDLNLYQSGHEQCPSGYVFGPARRTHFLFHYVESGCGRLSITDEKGGNEYTIGPRQGFLLFPGQLATYIADSRDPWCYLWVEIDGLRVKELLDQTSLSEKNPVYHPHTQESRERMFQELHYVVHHSFVARSLDIIGHLYLFLDNLIDSVRLPGRKRSADIADFYVQEAVNYIEQNYSRSLTVEEIAILLGIDRSYFGKLFKRKMGQSPQQFLINYRLVKAAALLKSTELAIKDICQQVGYQNQLHFSRAFKAAYGQCPRQWRLEQTGLE